MPSLKLFRDDVLHIGETLIAIATETEQTAEEFRQDKSHLEDNGQYYRFNVDRGLEEIGLEESKKRKEIAAATRRYIGSHGVFKQMEAIRNLPAAATASEPLRTQPSRGPSTALHDACSTAHVDKIASLLQESSADINSLDPRGFTPLLVATQKNHQEVVESLLNFGANVDGDDSSLSAEKTPLSFAIANSNTDMARLLLDKGAAIEARSKFNVPILGQLEVTPLGQAAFKGQADMVALLVERRAEVNALHGESCKTPLYLAAQQKHGAVIRILLQSGARYDITTASGQIPLSLLHVEQEEPLRQLMNNWASKGMYSEMAKLLVKRGIQAKKAYEAAVQQHASKNAALARTPVGPTTPQLASDRPRAANPQLTNGRRGSTKPQPTGQRLDSTNVQPQGDKLRNVGPTKQPREPNGTGLLGRLKGMMRG